MVLVRILDKNGTLSTVAGQNGDGCRKSGVLLMMSIALHVVRCRVYDIDDDDDEDEVNSMYT